MAKNNAQKQAFSALSGILGGPQNQQPEPEEEVVVATPKEEVKEVVAEKKGKKNEDNDPEAGFVRNTYLVRETFKMKMKIVSAKTNKPMKDLMDEAIGEYLAKYEKKNGEISL